MNMDNLFLILTSRHQIHEDPYGHDVYNSEPISGYLKHVLVPSVRDVSGNTCT